MINPAIFVGEPLLFKNQVYIYPPKIKEVVGNSKFGIFLKILTLTQDDIKEELQADVLPNPFEFLLINCYKDEQVKFLAEEAFSFFCKAKVEFLFSDKSIRIINQDSSEFLLEEDSFFEFQNAIRQSYGEKPLQPPEPFDPNEDPRIRRIKELAKERDRIKAKQATKTGTSLSVILTAICCMGIGITPLNIGEMSYAAIGPIMKMMQDKEKYDLDVRSLLAGADSKKIKPKYWIRNLD